MPALARLATVEPSRRTATLELIEETSPGISLADQAKLQAWDPENSNAV